MTPHVDLEGPGNDRGLWHNVSAELSRCALMCAEVEAAISHMVQTSDATALAGQGLQQIDRLGQILQDLSKVSNSLATASPLPEQAAAVDAICQARLHEVRNRLSESKHSNEVGTSATEGDLSLF